MTLPHDTSSQTSSEDQNITSGISLGLGVATPEGQQQEVYLTMVGSDGSDAEVSEFYSLFGTSTADGSIVEIAKDSSNFFAIDTSQVSISSLELRVQENYSSYRASDDTADTFRLKARALEEGSGSEPSLYAISDFTVTIGPISDIPVVSVPSTSANPRRFFNYQLLFMLSRIRRVVFSSDIQRMVQPQQ